jgi:RsiW-degrading membrane proteinase PrsW (M82 family)
MDQDILTLVAIIVCSIIPPIIYVVLMHSADRHRRIRFAEAFKAFLAGSSLSAVGGVLLSLALLIPIIFALSLIDGVSVLDVPLDSGTITLVTAVIVAPIAEELCKAGTVMIFRRRLTTLESGVIYGAAVGLGFAATENILYGYTASSDGLAVGLIVVGLRSLTGAFGHASYAAISGYGIARWNRSGGRGLSWVKFYLLSVLLHAFSNLIASMDLLVPLSDWSEMAIIGIIMAMDISIFFLLRKRVKELDKASMEYERSVMAPQTQQY